MKKAFSPDVSGGKASLPSALALTVYAISPFLPVSAVSSEVYLLALYLCNCGFRSPGALLSVTVPSMSVIINSGRI